MSAPDLVGVPERPRQSPFVNAGEPCVLLLSRANDHSVWRSTIAQPPRGAHYLRSRMIPVSFNQKR